MHVLLDVTTTADGLLCGSAQWGTTDAAVTFHGILELIAILETATANDAKAPQ